MKIDIREALLSLSLSLTNAALLARRLFPKVGVFADFYHFRLGEAILQRVNTAAKLRWTGGGGGRVPFCVFMSQIGRERAATGA